MEELKHKAGIRVANRMMIFEIASHFINTTFYFKILYVALSIVLICNVFEET